MTQIVKVKTGSAYEEMGSYSRIVSVGGFIFVSNTAGRNPETQIIAEDLEEQTLQVFANVERALAAVYATLADVVMSRVYVQNPEDIPRVMTIVGDKFRGVDPASTVTCPPLGSTAYKVELEVTAFQGASEMLIDHRSIAL